MKKSFALLFLFLFISSLSFAQTNKKTFSVKEAREALKFAAAQYTLMAKALPDSLYPRSYSTKDNKFVSSDYQWWCSGFFPGSLWYLFEFTKDDRFRNEAEVRTSYLEPLKYLTSHHDLGFMLYNSFGNGYRLARNDKYKEILITGARSLSTRFHKNVGLIKSWEDNAKMKYPVIIDNMMNLEYLFWASRQTGDSAFYRIAVSHADSTLKNHFRSDWSSYHVVTYDSLTGKVIKKMTAQGYSDESAWARGQSWGLYGYTMCYRETKDRRYLEAANKIASFLLNNPNYAKDGIPYWDYNAPDIPKALRDVSAGTIMCSALLELSQYASKDLGRKYFSAAELILSSLSKPEYLAKSGENGTFILKHSVGSIPNGFEIDVALSYADYYYIESLMRFIALKSGKK